MLNSHGGLDFDIAYPLGVREVLLLLSSVCRGTLVVLGCEFTAY